MLTVPTSNLECAERPVSQPYQPTADTACLAIVWVEGIDSVAQEEMILELLSASRGVNQAVFSRHKPDLLVIDYDRRKIQPLDLLVKISRQHVQAKLVGC